MSLSVRSEVLAGIAKITLTGRLDANTAPQFKTEIEKAAEFRPMKVALFLSALEYMASAGIRMLVFTKQKLGAAVDILIVDAQEAIVQTLEMTGVDKSVIFVNASEAAAFTG